MDQLKFKMSPKLPFGSKICTGKKRFEGKVYLMLGFRPVFILTLGDYMSQFHHNGFQHFNTNIRKYLSTEKSYKKYTSV